MEIIANDLPRFKQDITDYSGLYNSLMKQWEEMITHVSELNSMWEGEAHNEFMSTFETDRQKMQELTDFLQQLLQELSNAHTEYSQCENQVSGIIDSIGV